VTNFGRNITFTPRELFTPRSEEDVLAVLERCRGRRIRVIGSLHSWSAVAVGEDVLLDLRHLDQVQIERRGEHYRAVVGAGCTIKRLLSELKRLAGITLPSIGLITAQTIAGAVSTGTHGSGAHSLSHYVEELCVATYDATGQPLIRTISTGPELRAARCSLGCLGVIVSVTLRCRSSYRIEEHFREYDRLGDVLAAEADYPLQQFFLIPWRWTYFAQHRREVTQPRSRAAGLYRVYFCAVFDLAFHLNLLPLVRVLKCRFAVQFFYRQVLPLTVIRNWKVVDASQRMLVMHHDLFRHIEIELFVRRAQLAAALGYVRELLQWCDGDDAALSAYREQLQSLGLADDLPSLKGVYTHHYPICVRRVLPDDACLAMSSGSPADSYAISLISYARLSERGGFFVFASFAARSLTAMYDARPHWGKVCPLDAHEFARLYPELPTFRAVCQEFDPNGMFRNEWVDAVLFSS